MLARQLKPQPVGFPQAVPHGPMAAAGAPSLTRPGAGTERPSAAVNVERVARVAFRWHGLRVNEQSYPVTVLVKRPDGSSEQVRVGTAVRTADGFQLSLGELSIGASPVSAAAPPRRAAPASGGEGLVFPPYGRSKGAPIAGASIQDLEYYINGSRRTLNDPAKARWHDKERALLAAMEAELARQTGRTGGGESGDAFSGDYDGPPDHTDDDIPF